MNAKITEVTPSPENDKKMQNVCIFNLIQQKMFELKKMMHKQPNITRFDATIQS